MLVSVAGCTNTRFYNRLDFLPPDHNLSQYSAIAAMDSSVTSDYFTPRAQMALLDIPVIDGIMFQPFVVGVNNWSSLGGILTFNGCSRKVVISKYHLLNRPDGSLALRTILHEFTHQLDDWDRQGRYEFIDHREFALAVHQLLQDPKWKDEILDHIDSADRWITDIFGVGPMSELIAYVGSWVALGNGPDYIRRVYRKIYNSCSEAKNNLVGVVALQRH